MVLIFKRTGSVGSLEGGKSCSFPWGDTELGIFQSVADKRARRGRWEHVPPWQGAARRNRNQLIRLQRFWRERMRNCRGRILLPFRNSLSLLRLEAWAYLQGWSWRSWLETCFISIGGGGFEGTGGRGCCFILGLLNLVHFSFRCLKENWLILNYNRIRLIWI